MTQEFLNGTSYEHREKGLKVHLGRVPYISGGNNFISVSYVIFIF